MFAANKARIIINFLIYISSDKRHKLVKIDLCLSPHTFNSVSLSHVLFSEINKTLIMKLILFTVAIMFKCSSFSLSAPTDSLVEASSNRSDEWTPLSHGSPSLAYVTEDDDLGKTGVVIQFRRSIKSDNTEIEARRRSAIDKGFMRFGRSRNMIRFGRSKPDNTLQYDNDVNDDLEHNDNEVNEPFSMRMRKNGNMIKIEPRRAIDKGFMRFGRGNFGSFGRPNPDTLQYDNDVSEAYDYIAPPIRRSPDNKYDEHGKKILRLGRSSSEALSDENYDSPYSIDKSNDREKKAIEGNVLRFGRINPMRFGKKRSAVLPKAVASTSRIYCENNNCVFQEKENRLLENPDNDDKLPIDNYPMINNNKYDNYEQLNSLFGDDSKQQQGYGEYVITK
ncbi:hypothetical protein ACKWTF_008122 [Chironomus riparius]